MPAWPMPIHQTKLVMSKRPADRDVVAPDADALGHQIGERDEQQTGEQQTRCAKPTYQPIGVLRVRTIALILSVTEPNVCPGAITGGRPAPTIAWFGSSMG